jgi:hypothetical protein
MSEIWRHAWPLAVIAVLVIAAHLLAMLGRRQR